MKRFLLLALFLTSTTLGLVGCSENTKETVEVKKETPNGEVKEKQTTETTKTGNERDGR